MSALAIDYEEEGCTCSSSAHPPCGWCEDAPDPDSEAGLRRQVRALRDELGYERHEVERLRAHPPADAELVQKANEMASRLLGAAERQRVAVEQAEERQRHARRLFGLAVALACVGQLAAERAPLTEPSHFGFLEVD